MRILNKNNTYLSYIILLKSCFSPEGAKYTSLGQRPRISMQSILSPERAKHNSYGHVSPFQGLNSKQHQS